MGIHIFPSNPTQFPKTNAFLKGIVYDLVFVINDRRRGKSSDKLCDSQKGMTSPTAKNRPSPVGITTELI